ncbi:MAG TPA: hypothetical protein VGP02_09680 [Mycobacteriales bacterium]|jgi:hypothetical protein|nr:hypothetical protein [Mycobacteriales bacterium]
MAYEVDSALGTCLYRGDDLELACDIHDHETGAHLQVIPDVPDERRPTGAGWDRPPQARPATG